MDNNAFLNAYAAAGNEHIANHNALAATPPGQAAGLVSLTNFTDTVDHVRTSFCKDFPIAYNAFKKYSGLLSWIPGVGNFLPTILMVLTAVNTTVVPDVCSVPAAPSKSA